jgi:hypothetical protein
MISAVKHGIIREGALNLAYMYVSLNSSRPDPSSFKTPVQIATGILVLLMECNIKNLRFNSGI